MGYESGLDELVGRYRRVWSHQGDNGSIRPGCLIQSSACGSVCTGGKDFEDLLQQIKTTLILVLSTRI